MNAKKSIFSQEQQATDDLLKQLSKAEEEAFLLSLGCEISGANKNSSEEIRDYEVEQLTSLFFRIPNEEEKEEWLERHAKKHSHIHTPKTMRAVSYARQLIRGGPFLLPYKVILACEIRRVKMGEEVYTTTSIHNLLTQSGLTVANLTTTIKQMLAAKESPLIERIQDNESGEKSTSKSKILFKLTSEGYLAIENILFL